MNLFSRITLASALLAAVLASTSFAQPPEGGRGNRGGAGGCPAVVVPAVVVQVDAVAADLVTAVVLKVDVAVDLRPLR